VLAGVFILAILTIVISSTILPSWKVLFLLLIVIAGITFLFWRHFVKIYAKAQISLHETLAKPHETEENIQPIPTVLKSASLDTVTVPPGSPAAAKLIRELEVRSRTGASVVAIDRAGFNLVNPGPDDEILVGDQIILLGSPEQLQKARKLLTSLA
jgi:CPA2 family monovalent cation:H+ antiporter-2